MFDSASAGIFPAFAEINCMTQTHVFKRFCQKAQRNLNNSAFFHILMVVPFVCEKRIYNFKSLFFQSFHGSFSGFDNFFVCFASHRLTQHGFFHFQILLHFKADILKFFICIKVQFRFITIICQLIIHSIRNSSAEQGFVILQCFTYPDHIHIICGNLFLIRFVHMLICVLSHLFLANSQELFISHIIFPFSLLKMGTKIPPVKRPVVSIP
nr:MAG TPA: hypothetical protein [Caudoviricetes sp.]